MLEAHCLSSISTSSTLPNGPRFIKSGEFTINVTLKAKVLKKSSIYSFVVCKSTNISFTTFAGFLLSNFEDSPTSLGANLKSDSPVPHDTTHFRLHQFQVNIIVNMDLKWKTTTFSFPVSLHRARSAHTSTLCPAISPMIFTISSRSIIKSSDVSPDNIEDDGGNSNINAVDTTSTSSKKRPQIQRPSYPPSSSKDSTADKPTQRQSDIDVDDSDSAGITDNKSSTHSKLVDSSVSNDKKVDERPITVPVEDMEEGPVVETEANSNDSESTKEEGKKESSGEKGRESVSPREAGIVNSDDLDITAMGDVGSEESPAQSEEEPKPEPEDEPGSKLDDEPEDEQKDKPKGESEDAIGQTSVKLNLSDEQKAKARAAREAAESAAEKATARKADDNKKLRENLSRLFTTLGEKTRAFELGGKARDRSESLVESAITKGKEKDISQQERLKASAATAAKSVVAAITTQWQEKVMPFVRKKLPEEFADISASTTASVALGAVVSILLIPSLFSGGSSKIKTAEVKKLEAETTALEKKLDQQARLRSQSSKPKTVFPSDDKTEPSKSLSVPSTKSKLPASTTPTPSTVTPSPAPPPIAPPPIPEKPLVPPRPVTPAQPQTELLRLKDTTPDVVLSAIAKKLGTKGDVVISASFDSLYAEPTVALQVKKSYHSLSVSERRRIAELALQACRSLGYDRVTLIEEDSERQVAQAGIDVDLEDETENLRAEVRTLKNTSDRLAIKSNDDEMEISTLKARLEEERNEFSTQASKLERSIAALRKENSALSDDLNEAKEEIARIPDRLELEQRTLEAEKQSEKLSYTVEMLSSQLTKARSDEASAKEAKDSAVQEARKAEAEKQEALASVNARITEAQKEAESKAAKTIGAVKDEANTSAKVAESKVREMEERMQTSQRESEDKLKAALSAAGKEKDSAIEEAQRNVTEIKSKLESAQKEAATKLQDTTSSFEKQLSDERAASSKQLQETKNRYEAMLAESEKKAKANLDTVQKEADDRLATSNKDAKTKQDKQAREAKSIQESLSKERDDLRKELEKADARAQKAAAQSAKEREGLEKQIAKLQAKLKNNENANSSRTEVSPSSISSSTAPVLTKVGEKNPVPTPSLKQDAVAKPVDAPKNDKIETSETSNGNLPAQERSTSSDAESNESQFTRLQAKLFGGNAVKKTTEAAETK